MMEWAGTRIDDDGSDGDMSWRLTLHLLGRAFIGIENRAFPLNIEVA